MSSRIIVIERFLMILGLSVFSALGSLLSMWLLVVVVTTIIKVGL